MESTAPSICLFSSISHRLSNVILSRQACKRIAQEGHRTSKSKPNAQSTNLFGKAITCHEPHLPSPCAPPLMIASETTQYKIPFPFSTSAISSDYSPPTSQNPRPTTKSTPCQPTTPLPIPPRVPATTPLPASTPTPTTRPPTPSQAPAPMPRETTTATATTVPRLQTRIPTITPTRTSFYPNYSDYAKKLTWHVGMARITTRMRMGRRIIMMGREGRGIRLRRRSEVSEK
jgi:hypothetical protein